MTTLPNPFINPSAPMQPERERFADPVEIEAFEQVAARMTEELADIVAGIDARRAVAIIERASA